ncbi:hypothetical protein EUGRSUZ_C01682 [Eucalyptus grandis]|uniref:Uncharacterized protein n=2 Tax=Eucalyptus grandis TaxID=71139 RepID=A0ACC3LEB4_EUCGR|nr:hypothetical protein EUGRSUZ_C01682 [Eucalyptus grandis]
MINHYGDGIKHAGQLKKTMSVHGSHLEQEMKLTNFDITDLQEVLLSNIRYLFEKHISGNQPSLSELQSLIPQFLALSSFSH